MQKYLNGLVVLNFTAEGCMPCRLQKPIFQQAAEELAGVAAFYVVDLSEQPALAARFGVMSIPTIVVLRDGEERWRSVGLTEKDEIVGAINNEQLTMNN